MSKTIITEIADQKDFMRLIENNPGLIVIKFGAEWCGPCKLIKKAVNGFFLASPPEVICADIDVDSSINLYTFLKAKKMVNGIPAILCYKKGNTTWIPDDSVVGANPAELDAFFKRCGKHLVNSIHFFPLLEKV